VSVKRTYTNPDIGLTDTYSTVVGGRSRKPTRSVTFECARGVINLLCHGRHNATE